MSFTFHAKSQDLGKFDIRSGIGRYPLGSKRSLSDTLLKFTVGGEMAYKSWVEYIYQIPEVFHKKYIINGVEFNNVMLTYVNDTLIRLNLIRIYTPKLLSEYKTTSKTDFKKIYEYLKEQWRNKGKKKTFIRIPAALILSKGYEWKTVDRVLKVSLYEDKSNRPCAIVEIIIEMSKYN